MESGRVVPRRRKVGVLFMLLGLLTGTFNVLGPRASADPIDTGSDIGNFEIDGNFALDNAANIDWGGIADLAGRLYFDDDLLTPDPNGPGDQGFVGGAKEFDRSTWGCSADSGKTPDKDDLKYVLAYPNLSIANATVAFSYVRNKSQGNTNVVLELNESSINSCSPTNDRTVGDLLLHFDFPGGDGLASLEAYVWDGNAFAPFDVPAGVANATTNASAIAVPATISALVSGVGLPTTVDARDMGEAVIDLFALQDALEAANLPVDEVLECPGLGAANVRTRSSGDSTTSQLHDQFPEIGIDLSNCASLKLKKVDDLGQPMEGVQFGLFASEPDALAGTPVAQLPTDPPQDLVCTTDASGVCTFPKVPSGDYYINEIDLPAGYTADPELPKAVGLDPFQDLDLSDDDNEACAGDINAAGCEWFVNTLRTGSVLITKVVVDGNGDPLTLTDITYLDGIAFELQDQTTQETIQKRGGGDATCTLDLDDPADDPSCLITDVPFGTYDVVEPGPLPAGISAGPSVPVTVDEDSPAVAEVDYENPADPLNISIDKAGPDTANVGDTITYTFSVGLGDLPFDTTDDVDLQSLTSVQVIELINLSDPGQLFDDRCDVSALAVTDKDDVGPLGDSWLEDGEVWTYQCQHLVSADEAVDSDGTELWNRAQVSGTDRFDRTDTDTDDHLVTILLPDLQVVKQAADGVDAGTAPSGNETIDAPGTATYTVTVTNVGAGIARNATLTDTLPAGSWTVSLANEDGNDACPVGGSSKSGSFTCTFGDLAPGATKTVTVSRAVTIANDCAVVLVNNAGVATTYQDVDIDPNSANDTSSAAITVRCPDVGVVKTATNSPISAGERAEWTITLTNNGAGVANDVFLVDSIPAGLSAPQIGGPDAASCSLVGNAVTCDFGDLPPNDGAPGGPDTRVITVSGLTDPADCASIPNTATVASTSQGAPYVDSNPTNNTSMASVVVQCPDLVIDKSTTTGTVSAGESISFDITVTNNGPGTAFGVTLSDPLPTGTGISWSENSAPCSIAGGVLSCSFGDLADDQSASVTLTSGTTEASCKTYDNTATADATNDNPVNDSASILVQCPDISITKTADAATVTAGDEIGFTVTVSNSAAAGTGTAFGVTLGDPLPAGDGIDWSIQSQSGGAGCAITGAVGAEVLSCGPKDLAPGASFSVHVVSDTQPTGEICSAARLPNTATADATNDAPVQASATTSVQCPDIGVTKVADDASVSAGEQIGFTITVSNGGPGVAYGVSLSDPMPVGVNWTLDSSTAGAGCSLSAGDVLTCGPVDLDSGESFEAHLVADTTEDDCALYENTASADASNDAPVTASDDTLVKCPGLNITKDADDPETVTAGDEVGFTIEVTNDAGEGVGTADDVTLNDPLPAGDGVSWTVESQAGGAGCVVNGTAPSQTLVCGPIDLDPGEGFSVHVVSDTDPSGEECVSGTLPNTATADADNHAPITASDTIAIECPDISITKVADADIVDAGDDIGFTIEVTNAGPGQAKDVTISDPLPAGDGVVWTVDPAVEGCTILLGMLLCQVGDLAPDSSFSVHVTGTTPGTIGDPDLPAACKVYDNTATASASNDADETASDSTEVICPLDITIVKDGPALAHRGDEITYTFTVTNSGEADLVEVVLTDAICDAGTLDLVDDADGDTTLAIGEEWTYECTRVITATDPDPLPNTATVVGTDVRDRTTEDTDDHLVDLIAPAIQVVKTVDNATPGVGQTVTFTYVVTNTGDTTLFNVTVVDDQLGPIGTVAELAAGASSTLTKTMVVAADSPTRNVATATGADVLGKTVTDDDPETITVVLGAVIERPVVAAPAQLPRTGAESRQLMLLSGLLLVLGGLMVASGQGATLRTARRRRS